MTSVSTGTFDTFFRSVPSDKLTNAGRLVLHSQIRYEPLRVGILYSKDDVYEEVCHIITKLHPCSVLPCMLFSF